MQPKQLEQFRVNLETRIKLSVETLKQDLTQSISDNAQQSH